MSLWTNLTEEDRWQTVKNMETYGGGFASRLAAAWGRADLSNSNRLAAAFPDLIEKFQPENWSTKCVSTL